MASIEDISLTEDQSGDGFKGAGETHLPLAPPPGHEGEGSSVKTEEYHQTLSSATTSTSIKRQIVNSGTTLTTVHKCLDCNKVFNNACYLTQHNKSLHSGDKPFKCMICGKRFTRYLCYQEHLSKHAGEKMFKCEICPKQFNHNTDLRRHMYVHSGDKPFACESCGKRFIRRDHMLKHHATHQRKV
jgi:uncharacterized Zn-finger protein